VVAIRPGRRYRDSSQIQFTSQLFPPIGPLRQKVQGAAFPLIRYQNTARLIAVNDRRPKGSVDLLDANPRTGALSRCAPLTSGSESITLAL